MAKITKIISNIIFAISIILLSAYFILRFMGIAEIYKVKTGSMEDGIHAGDYILIYKKDKYDIGDVVTYKKDNYHVTHRIIKKNGENVITKGDANNIEDDEINVKSIVGKVIYSGKYLNTIINFKYAIASFLLAMYLFSCYFFKKDEESEVTDEKIQEELVVEENSEKEEIELSQENEEEKKKDKMKQDISLIYEKDKQQENKKINNKKKKEK